MELLLSFFPFAVVLLLVFGIRAVVRRFRNNDNLYSPRKFTGVELGLLIFAVASIVITLSFALTWN